MTDYPTELTHLIVQAREGDREAEGKLYAMIYDDLHRAAGRIAREGHGASASSLVHEGFVRLFRKGQLSDVPSRQYFFFAATRKMRDILAERCRKKDHLSDASPLDSFADQFLADFRSKTHWEFLAVHNALDRFMQSNNPRKRRRHQLIELIHFAGLKRKEAADILEISNAQAGEDQRLALAELAVELERMEP